MLSFMAFVACGSNEDEEVIVDEVLPNPDMISYSFDKKYIACIYWSLGLNCIRVYDKSGLVWERPIEKIYEKVNYGYGEIETVVCSIKGVFFFPDSHNVYAVYTDGISPYIRCFCFYDLNGNLLARVSTNANGTLGRECPWDKSLCIVRIYPDTEYIEGVIYYQTFDENGNNEIYKCINSVSSSGRLLIWDNFIRILNTSRYISYDDSYLLFVTINEDEKVITIDAECKIYAFIKEKYPQEVNSPRYEITNIYSEENVSIITIDVTLYSGKKENLEITVDNYTGKIIE